MILRHARAPLEKRIDAVLPQTQCRQCGFAGCMPYAEAIARGDAAINRCPPGGARVIRRIARLTARPAIALDSACGVEKPRHEAIIDEARCIGCTLCIRACPVDAIVGAPRLMHTVIASECTGCELCLPPCPVDCIVLEPAPWTPIDRLLARPERAAKRARERYAARRARLEREQSERAERLAQRAAVRSCGAPAAASAAERKRAIVAAAVERARRRLAGRESART